MVQAILEGRKSQTRRIMKIQPDSRGTRCTNVHFEDWHGRKLKCPYGWVGDILWVKETWQEVFELEYDHHAMDGSCVNIREWIPNFDSIEKTCVGLSSEWSCASMPERNKYYVYRASDIQFCDEKHKLKWKPSIFMPKAASRIKLEITDVRVERVQDISDADAISEGLRSKEYTDGHQSFGKWYSSECGTWHPNPVDAYSNLWESINGKGSWEKNPWVWCISFKRVK